MILSNKKDDNKFFLKLKFEDEINLEIKKENFIFDNPETQTSVVFGGKKEEFNFIKLKKILTNIVCSTDRTYQIDAQSFVNKNIDEKLVVQTFIYINEQYNGLEFSLKTTNENNKNKNHSIFTNLSFDLFLDDILISKQLSNVRYLQNMPPNILTIDKMTEIANSLVKKNKKLKIKILEKSDLEKLGMNLILGVNSGSKQSVKVIIIEYKNNINSNDKTTLIGKGIMFDTGGYNLKTGKHMLDMKFDMSGAAIALYTIDTVAKLNIKTNLSIIIPLTDNALDSLAQVPETILTSMSKKTVEVANTDAEGRLILADAIYYAATKLKSTLIIDIATLTGTIIYALGKYTGVWSTSDTIWKQMKKSANLVNELVWRMPLDKMYIENLFKSTYADMLSCSNTEYPDSNIAAAWLNQFANDCDYIHLDIAGSSDKNSDGKSPMLKTLIHFLKNK